MKYQTIDMDFLDSTCFQKGFGDDLRFIVSYSLDPESDIARDNHYSGINRIGDKCLLESRYLDEDKLELVSKNKIESMIFENE